MNTRPSPAFHPAHVIRILRQYPLHWLGPLVVVTLAAVAFALVRPATWQASQALIVRPEAANNREEPGQFDHADQMKTVQETILEVAKSRGVLEAALVEVGPPADADETHDAWPTARDVEDLREQVELVPPKGTEFGSTELFYLNGKDHDRDRAIALVRAICDQLETRSKQIRDAKAKSMIDELGRSVHLAEADLDASTAKLSGLEREVGADLAELRILNDSNTGDSALQRTAGEIRGELRQAQATHHANRELLGVLEAAQDDPGRLIATPNRLLESQPALQRLKNGLVDAQLHTAELGGRMSDEHPLVQAAHEAEQGISRHLHDELAIAIRGLKIDLRLGAERLEMLRSQLADATGRLDRLAGLRATYANLVAETRHRTGLVEQAEQNLAHARASQASAATASLISRVDGPDAGSTPLGPGRAMICLIGLAGGLLAGFGVLMLTVPSEAVVTPLRETASVPAVHEGNGHKPTSSRPNVAVLDPVGSLSLTQALRKVGFAAVSRN
jgi:polysaccharide biosynthesis transport protein